MILIGDFNAHHPYSFDKDANQLGNGLFGFLVDKDLMVVNNNEPTRKHRIIDLTIISNSLKEKVMNWKLQKVRYLNIDHDEGIFNELKKEVWQRIVRC